MAKSRRKRKSITKNVHINEAKNNIPKNAGFFLRLAAWFYDFMIIIAVLILAAGVLVSISEALIKAGYVRFENYIDTADFLTSHPIAFPLFSIYLSFICIGFFVLFWCRGQTLGMRAWSLVMVDEQGGLITKKQAIIRFFTSAFGIANLGALFHPQRRGFHDIWAKTHVIERRKR
ncbi:RDD family protein [Vibrio sp. RC27]